MARDPEGAVRLELTAIGATQEAWQRTYAGNRATDPIEIPATPQQFTKHPTPGAPLRAQSDRQAAWRCWHVGVTEPALTETERAWYQLFEQARVEELASRELKGMARNLGQLDALMPEGGRQARLYRLVRQRFAEGRQHAPTLAATRAERSTTAQKTVATPPADTPNPEHIHPPQKEGSGKTIPQTTGWLTRLLRRPQRVTPAYPQMPPPSDAEISAALDQVSHQLQDGTHFAILLWPLIQRLAAAPDVAPEAPQPDALGSAAEAAALTDPEPLHPAAEPNHAPPESLIDIESETAPTHPLADETEPATTATPSDETGTPYRPYSTHWDEERPPRHFCTPEDQSALQSLDPADQARMRQLALRLQRQLLSARQRHWQFDQEAGRLDSRRLAKLLIPGASPRIFREEQVSPVPEACVTLLVDQSGSMRGRPQQIAVQAIDLAVQTLEVCRISCEVLGYTTVDGADNPVARSWRSHGQPARPGRLNALRHLIYKSAQEPWRRARPNLGLMLRADFGRENLDGEALDWAARRLAARPEPRKILLVLSDAAPYDAATVAVHGRPYLEAHLRKVITDIEASAIQLVAIGTTHRVGYYYRKAVILSRHDTVADTLFNQLGQLLTPPESFRRP